MVGRFCLLSHTNTEWGVCEILHLRLGSECGVQTKLGCITEDIIIVQSKRMTISHDNQAV